MILFCLKYIVINEGYNFKENKKMRLLKRSDWEKVAMEVINGHSGKRKVYQTYMRLNPVMAEKYARFISKNRFAMYISWDKERNRFVA